MTDINFDGDFEGNDDDTPMYKSFKDRPIPDAYSDDSEDLTPPKILRNVSQDLPADNNNDEPDIDAEFLRAGRFQSTNAAGRDKLGIYVFIAIGIGLINLALSLWQGFSYERLARKDSPIAVQLNNGKNIQIQRIDPQQRSPESITKFVRAFLLQTFTCTNRKPVYNLEEVGKAEKDPGIPVSIPNEQPVQIPTIAWAASWSVSESFRERFLVNLGKVIAPYNLMQTGQEGQMAINIRNVSTPVLVKAASGQIYWEVTVNATIVITPKNQPQGVTIPYNKILTIKGAEPVNLEELSQEVKSDDLVSIIYQARGSGLVISDFRDYDPSTQTTPTK